jgi:hypothetical protein
MFSRNVILPPNYTELQVRDRALQFHVGLCFIYAKREGREHDKYRDLREGLRKICVRGLVEQTNSKIAVTEMTNLDLDS